MLRCPKCETSYAVPEAFDHCESSWPAGPWLFFECPACGEMWILDASQGRLALGEFDEFPPGLDGFVPRYAIDVPGLGVEAGVDGTYLYLAGQMWVIPV